MDLYDDLWLIVVDHLNLSTIIKLRRISKYFLRLIDARYRNKNVKIKINDSQITVDYNGLIIEYQTYLTNPNHIDSDQNHLDSLIHNFNNQKCKTEYNQIFFNRYQRCDNCDSKLGNSEQLKISDNRFQFEHDYQHEYFMICLPIKGNELAIFRILIEINKEYKQSLINKNED